MKTSSVQSRAASIVIAVAVMLQIQPAAAGAPDVGLAMAQGSRFPGVPVPSTENTRNKHRAPVEITFTKWITTGTHMAGFTGGDVVGVFAGEVLQRQVSTNPDVNPIIRLEAIYEVQAGDHSFTALIRGGTNGETGAALLDGVILAGWRTGAQVHVAFQTMTNCAGAPDGRTCFEGTIHIDRAPKE